MAYDMFLDRFLDNVSKMKEKKLFTFVDDKGKPVESYTYEEFEALTRSVAIDLLNKGCKKGENVVLVYPPCLDFIVAFVACLRAGVVAVPVYPPHPSRKKDINQFIAVQSSCQAKVALTNSDYKHAKKLMAFKNALVNRSVNKTWPELKWITTNTVKPSDESSEAIDSATDADLAFLQYTSGSTSLPKGVMLSHRNISHNLSCIVRALDAQDYVKVVSWLPQYHDMGLIGAYLGVLYCGGSGVYMSPFTLIKNPVVWLEQISIHKATHIQAPNFAYRLTQRKFLLFEEKVGVEEAKKRINLSSLRHIFNAAEPIDVKAMNSFCDKFEPYGLNREAFSPGYGLAENTVYVCDNGRTSVCVDSQTLERKGVVEEVEPESSEHCSLLQGCGDPHRFPEAGIFVRIVKSEEDKHTLVREENVVGEIWISSPSKSEGYFGKPELTNEQLKAKISVPADDKETGEEELESMEWLRTGDLGFFRNKELFICGRIKDLVIVRGRNHFPQDIEFTVENDHDFAGDLRPGCSAAFSVLTESGEEGLVVVAEVRNTSLGKKKKVNLIEVATAIKRAVLQHNEINPTAVVLIKQGTVVKTTSGKIKRHGNKQAFLSSSLQELFRLDSDTNNDGIQEPERPVKKTKATSPVQALPKGMKSSDEILQELKDECARLMLTDISEIPVNVPLVSIGMDSVYLTEFKDVMIQKYNVEVEEEHLFSDTMTLTRLSVVVFSKMAGVDVPKADVKVDVVSATKPKKPRRKRNILFCF